MRKFFYIVSFIVMMLFTVCVSVAFAIPYIILAVTFRFWQADFILGLLSYILAINDALTDCCGEILNEIK